MVPLTERAELHRSPAASAVGSALSELAGQPLGTLDLFEIYSCFPVAVQIQLVALVVTCAVTFVLARLLGRKWRAKRHEREQSATRAAESRQVRRARERRQR